MPTKQAQQNHTPEPWHYKRDGECVMAPDDWVCIVHNNDRREANARRIVACVNACKGINPEAVPELLEALQRLLSLGKSEGFGQ